MDKDIEIQDNLIALLQLVEEFQAEYNVRFDIWAEDEVEVSAVTIKNEFKTLASVERR